MSGNPVFHSMIRRLLAVTALVGIAVLAFIGFSTRTVSAEWNIGHTSTGIKSGGDLGMPPSRSVRFEILTDDSLTRKIADKLQPRLRELFEEVSFGGPLPAGTRTPDIYIKLQRKYDTASHDDNKTRELYTWSVGTEPWPSTSNYSDEYSPPVGQHSQTGELNAEATLRGWLLNKEDVVAEKLAESLGKQFSEYLTKIREEEMPSVALPAVFFGPYQPHVPLVLPGFEIKQLESFYGLFLHNDTHWLIKNPSWELFLTDFAKQLEAEGWHVDKSPKHLWAKRQNEIWEVHPKDRDALTADSGDLIAEYRNRFTRKEQQAAIESLFESKASPEFLLSFEGNMSEDQRDSLMQRMESGRPCSAKICLRLAQFHQSKTRNEEARKMIAAANAFDCATKERVLSKEIREQWKKLGGKSVAPELTPDLLRDLRFLELTPFGEWEIQRNDFEPVYFFCALPEGQVAILTARVLRGKTPGKHEFETMHYRPTPSGDMRSWSKAEGYVDQGGVWRAEDETTVNSLCAPLSVTVTGSRVSYTGELLRLSP